MKRFNIKLTIVVAVLAAVGFSESVIFAANTNQGDELTVSISRADLTELSIELQTVESVANNCDLMIRRVEFIPANDSLMIDTLAPETCPIDSFGRRSGKVKWSVPNSLRSKGALELIINSKKLGSVQWDSQALGFSKIEQ